MDRNRPVPVNPSPRNKRRNPSRCGNAKGIQQTWSLLIKWDATANCTELTANWTKGHQFQSLQAPFRQWIGSTSHFRNQWTHFDVTRYVKSTLGSYMLPNIYIYIYIYTRTHMCVWASACVRVCIHKFSCVLLPTANLVQNTLCYEIHPVFLSMVIATKTIKTVYK